MMKADNILAIAIASRIHKLCEEKNTSINKIAQKGFLTQNTVQNISSGNGKNPKLKTLILICYGLNITLVDFFYDPLFQDLNIEYLI